MGRQSARLWYKNKDHKDIYFQGHYHDKMYVGSQLVWEKLYGHSLVPLGVEATFSRRHPSYISNDFFYGVQDLDRSDRDKRTILKKVTLDGESKTIVSDSDNWNHFNFDFLDTTSGKCMVYGYSSSIQDYMARMYDINSEQLLSFTNLFSDEDYLYSYPGGYIHAVLPTDVENPNNFFRWVSRSRGSDFRTYILNVSDDQNSYRVSSSADENPFVSNSNIYKYVTFCPISWGRYLAVGSYTNGNQSTQWFALLDNIIVVRPSSTTWTVDKVFEIQIPKSTHGYFLDYSKNGIADNYLVMATNLIHTINDLDATDFDEILTVHFTTSDITYNSITISELSSIAIRLDELVPIYVENETIDRILAISPSGNKILSLVHVYYESANNFYYHHMFYLYDIASGTGEEFEIEISNNTYIVELKMLSDEYVSIGFVNRSDYIEYFRIYQFI